MGVKCRASRWGLMICAQLCSVVPLAGRNFWLYVQLGHCNMCKTGCACAVDMIKARFTVCCVTILLHLTPSILPAKTRTYSSSHVNCLGPGGISGQRSLLPLNSPFFQAPALPPSAPPNTNTPTPTPTPHIQAPPPPNTNTPPLTYNPPPLTRRRI